jgi:hypothetical protein
MTGLSPGVPSLLGEADERQKNDLFLRRKIPHAIRARPVP